ncbi:hypothetical protein [Cetobacterium sp.]|uniref:hypothetical protein n=1 Tax=Cetobacterium sp. TaxID=2071632 RepID=UPI003EE52BB9
MSLVIFLLILYRVFIVKDIFSVNLFILILCLEIYDQKLNFLNIKILKISLLGVIFYSIIYFGQNGRLIHTSIKEINQSGMILFLLCIGFYVKNEYKYFIFTSLLLILTFSRTALLALVVFLLIDRIKLLRKASLYIKNFYIQLILTFFILFGLANSFEKAFFEKKIVDYQQTFIERLKSPYDYSNFFRFTINKNLLEIMYKKKIYLLNGIKEDELTKENLNLTRIKNIPFRNNKPHNFMFSYLQIYGILSVFIFIGIGKILNKLTNEKNIGYIISLLIYTSLLGIGLNSYYLLLIISIAQEFNINKKEIKEKNEKNIKENL